MRWLHNDPSLPTSEWQTPTFAQIKKRSLRWHRENHYFDNEKEEREAVRIMKQIEAEKGIEYLNKLGL